MLTEKIKCLHYCILSFFGCSFTDCSGNPAGCIFVVLVVDVLRATPGNYFYNDDFSVRRAAISNMQTSVINTSRPISDYTDDSFDKR